MYGNLEGASRAVLHFLVAAERSAWCGYEPSVIYLLDRSSAQVNLAQQVEYAQLLESERTSCHAEFLSNNGSPNETVDAALACLDRLGIGGPGASGDPRVNHNAGCSDSAL